MSIALNVLSIGSLLSVVTIFLSCFSLGDFSTYLEELSLTKQLRRVERTAELYILALNLLNLACKKFYFSRVSSSFVTSWALIES